MVEKIFPLEFILINNNIDTVPNIIKIKSLDDLENHNKTFLVINQKDNENKEYNFIKGFGKIEDYECVFSRAEMVSWNVSKNKKTLSQVYEGVVGEYIINEVELGSVYDVSAYQTPKFLK